MELTELKKLQAMVQGTQLAIEIEFVLFEMSNVKSNRFKDITTSLNSWGSYENFQGYTNPRDVNWNNLIKTSKERSAVKNSFTLNPETLNLNFENMIPFIPDTSSYIGRPRGEVFAEIIKQYSKDYYIPGFEYQQWCRENPEKIPPILKEKDSNGNYVYYYTPGTVLGSSGGSVFVPFGHWYGDVWNRNDGWVWNGWYGSERVLLLPRIVS